MAPIIFTLSAQVGFEGSNTTFSGDQLLAVRWQFEGKPTTKDKIVLRVKNGPNLTLVDRFFDGDKGKLILEKPIILGGRSVLHLATDSLSEKQIARGFLSVIHRTAQDYQPDFKI